jgi:hypothetical protein
MAEGPGEVADGSAHSDSSATAAPAADAIRSQIEHTRAEMSETRDRSRTPEKAAEEWHQDQAAAGVQAVGIGARTLKRVAGVMGLGKRPSGTGASAPSEVPREAAVAHENPPARKRGSPSAKSATRKTESSVVRTRRSNTRAQKTKGR